jgi:hypothetical protein
MMTGTSTIHSNMDVIGSDGRRLGVVGKLAGDVILVDTPERGELPPTLPRAWVADVNGAVRLSKPSHVVRQVWRGM